MDQESWQQYCEFSLINMCAKLRTFRLTHMGSHETFAVSYKASEQTLHIQQHTRLSSHAVFASLLVVQVSQFSLYPYNVQDLLDRYFELLPGYQGVPLSALKFQRVLFGGFPCYSSGPLQPQFDRILQVHHTIAFLYCLSPFPMLLRWESPVYKHLAGVKASIFALLCDPPLPVMSCKCHSSPGRLQRITKSLSSLLMNAFADRTSPALSYQLIAEKMGSLWGGCGFLLSE